MDIISLILVIAWFIGGEAVIEILEKLINGSSPNYMPEYLHIDESIWWFILLLLASPFLKSIIYELLDNYDDTK